MDSPMTKAEYDQLKQQIQDQYEEALTVLGRKYAAGNKKYGVGDILVAEYGDIIKVEKVSWTIGRITEYPQCVYHGSVLRKDLVPKKSGVKTFMYESRVELRIEP